jgi:hypothetical protein
VSGKKSCPSFTDLGGRDRAQHHRFAIGREYRAIGLTGNAAGFRVRVFPPHSISTVFTSNIGFSFHPRRPIARRGTQFSQTRFLQIIMRLVPNQQSAIIVSRKSVYPPVSMLEYSGDKVGGYAQIERSITPTGHDVDKSSFRPFGPSGLLPSQEHVAFLCSCEGRNLVE